MLGNDRMELVHAAMLAGGKDVDPILGFQALRVLPPEHHVLLCRSSLSESPGSFAGLHFRNERITTNSVPRPTSSPLSVHVDEPGRLAHSLLWTHFSESERRWTRSSSSTLPSRTTKVGDGTSDARCSR